ncbi:MAG: Nramp family divalent metal transporter, partial [Pseudomonadota bacterium]
MKTTFFGPGTLVAAAFIGPGTLTVCTLAGAEYGLTLLWALLFSIVATMILQEAAARLGYVTKRGLAANIREHTKSPWIRLPALVLVLSGIVVGAIAYEAGNIKGGALGLAYLLPEMHIWSLLIIGAIAFGLLWFGRYRTIELVLVFLVGVMSVVFVLSAFLLAPSPTDLIKGLLVPTIPSGAEFLVIALIGTKIVPYNLFLHS